MRESRVPEIGQDLIQGMNPEQVEVVGHRDGPLLVAAVAGCGKTRVLVHRIKALVLAGFPAERILAVTFSVKAAREMNDRLVKLNVARARVGTFHSVSWQIVREERPDIADGWHVDDRDQYRTVVKDALGYRHLDWKTADLTQVLHFIGRCKSEGALPSSARARELAEENYRRRPSAQRQPDMMIAAYEAAELVRRERLLMTYDDMLVEAALLLRESEDRRARIASRWDAVLQDECQDENLVQREIAAMLARDHRRYMVVGDPAQSIYGFRGADPSGMLRFEGEWSARVVRMGRNYRCARRIVDVANRLLLAMRPDTHLGTPIVAERPEPGEVAARRYASFDEEGEGVARRLRELNASGTPWKSCAVLYRTNAQSRGVEEALLSNRVPYVVIGGSNFYERREVRDLLAYLRVAAGTADWEHVRRSINTPFRFLGKAFLERLGGGRSPARADWTAVVAAAANGGGGLQARQRTSALEWCGIVDELRSRIERGALEKQGSDLEVEARPARLLEGLVTDLRYNQWLTRDEGSESPENNRVSNVRELIRAASRFPTVAALLEYVDETIDKADRRREEGEADCVVLTSLHRSKGLEWPVVFVIGANEKILPHGLAEDDQEERRLFYVGVTRARDVLEVSCVVRAAVGARVVRLEPSRFLAEGGLEVVDDRSCAETSVEDPDEQQVGRVA